MMNKSSASVCNSGCSFDYSTQLYICSKVDQRLFKCIDFLGQTINVYIIHK